MRTESKDLSAAEHTWGNARSLFFPPSFGRRCPEGAEVGVESGHFTYVEPTPSRCARLPLPKEGAREMLEILF